MDTTFKRIAAILIGVGIAAAVQASDSGDTQLRIRHCMVVQYLCMGGGTRSNSASSTGRCDG